MVDNLLNLLASIQEPDSHFWGSVRINFQDGKICHVEIIQTMKQETIRPEVVLIREVVNGSGVLI